jgi:hypothetical protein
MGINHHQEKKYLKNFKVHIIYINLN